MAGNKKLKLSIFEIVAYAVTGLLGLWGLVYLVFGFVVKIDVTSDLASYDKTQALNFLAQGFIILGVAVVAAVIVLLAHAKIAEREYERQQRRNQVRMNRGKNEEETVVEAESNPVE